MDPGEQTPLETPESAALRYNVLAERTAQCIPDVSPHTPTRPIRSVAVIGAGTMGAGIAQCFLDANVPVRLFDADSAALERAQTTIRVNYENAVRKGRLTASEHCGRLKLLAPVLDYEQFADVDLFVEAAYEDLEVKQQIFRRLDRVARPDAILATNTSTLDIDRIAGVTRRPADVIGLHFFSPAHIMRLLEIVRGRATGEVVLATAMALARRLGKVAVVAAVCDGFIGNRMLGEYKRQAAFMLEEGASPLEVDSAIESFGFAMGPFRVSDLAGNDIGWQIRKRQYQERPDLKHSQLGDVLCERGRLGQKTNAGWYDYAPGQRTALPSVSVDAMIAAHRQRISVVARRLAPQEIVERLVYALVNEGARLLAEGVATRASDIDVVYVRGYGFPAWRGGPMYHADRVGLEHVLARMTQFANNPHGDPMFWQPAALLSQLVADKRTLNEWVSPAGRET